MADRYWVGGTASWDATAGSKWATTSGGTGGETVPTSSDDVYFDANSGSVTVSVYTTASVNCRNLNFTGFTGTCSHPAGASINIYGDCTLVSGMTFSSGTGAYFQFYATSSKTITSGGKVFPTIRLYGVGGSWTLGDALECGAIDHQYGTFDTANYAVTMFRYIGNYTNTRTLTLGSSTVTINGASAGAHLFNVTTTNLTITSNTATLDFTANPATGYAHFNSNTSSVDFGGLSLKHNVAGSFRVTAPSCTFKDINRTGTAVKTDSIRICSNITVTGTLKLYGDSVTNRLHVHSGDTSKQNRGTRYTITNTGATIDWQHLDFEDIGLSTAYDASAITGLSGDCGGNSNITFTASQDHYWVGGTGSWSSTGEWSTSSGGSSGARVPLPQDDCYFDNASFSGNATVTVDMIRIGKNVDFSSYTEGASITIIRGAVFAVYGSLIWPSVGTISGSYETYLAGRGSYTVRSSGRSFRSIYMDAPGGTYTQEDAVSCNYSFIHYTGTWNSAGYSFTISTTGGAGGYTTSTGSQTRELQLSSSTMTLTNTGTVLHLTGSGFTFVKGTSIIEITNTTATAKTVTADGVSFATVKFAGDAITVSGSNSYDDFQLNTAGYTTGLLLTNGKTQTVSAFSSNGSAGNLAKMASTSASATSAISKSSGTVTEDYMHLTYIAATGGATWYAGANSTDNGGNTGWIFSGPSSSYTITGAITVDSTIASTVAYNRNAALAGSIALDSTIAAALAYNRNASIAGSVSVVSSISAGLAYNRNASLIGAILIETTVASTLEYAASASITGSILVTVDPASTLQYNRHATLAGSIVVDAVPASAMQWTSSVGPSISGSVLVQLAVAASMTYAWLHRFATDVELSQSASAVGLSASAAAQSQSQTAVLELVQ